MRLLLIQLLKIQTTILRSTNGPGGRRRYRARVTSGFSKAMDRSCCKAKALFGAHLTSCDRSAPLLTARLCRIMFDASVQSFPISYGQRPSGL